MSRLVIFIIIILLSSPVYAGRKRAHRGPTAYSDDDTIAEIRFGRNLAARVLGKYKIWDNEQAIDYVNVIGTGLITNLGRTDIQFFFTVLDTTEINAYAIPGGYIMLTRGALQLMDNEAQLAGVLAHEIAHINQRHVVKKLKIRGDANAFLAGIGAAAGGGAVSGAKILNKMLDDAIDMLFEIGIEKKYEFMSDAESVQILVAIGYDWQSYLDYLSKINQKISKEQQQVISKTHPPIEDRIEKIRSLAKDQEISDYKGKKHKKRFQEYVE